MKENTITINGRNVKFNEDQNLLQVIRAANINLPTFCYHSELSVYGACRLCLVDIEGKGVVTSCSIKPEEGMIVKTHTSEVRNIRKISLELLLANHEQKCTSCTKSSSCKLQVLASDLGVDKIRFKKTESHKPLDDSSHALVRDPNKCILCGDCVRACEELQGIGAIEFAFRGSDVTVLPAFGKGLAEVECVDCGQCARVCPTGSLIPKSETANVWEEIDNSAKKVVAQIAPAVRVAIGEAFGIEPGTVLTGQIVTALKMLGFDKVYDTSFAADLTVIEEANEFLDRTQQGGKMPLFTSCCPGWVKYAEQYYPEFIDNLSSCKSPQQMFGSVAKEVLPENLNEKRENIVVVSIMPCTAKKVEARKEKFKTNNQPDVDYVLTTQELIAMIKESGIKFEELTPDSLDLPLGFKTGAGVLFGNSGGVSEAVLRYAAEKLSGEKCSEYEFVQVRGENGIRETQININGEVLNLAVVHGLKNAGNVLKQINSGEKNYHLVEVMACPGGCIGGAGQPVCFDDETRKKRTEGIYNADKMLQIHKSQDNPYITKLYNEVLGKIGGDKAHDLLHTKFSNRKRMIESELSIITASDAQKLEVRICIGTNCFVKNSQKLMKQLVDYVEEKGLEKFVDVKGTFCMEKCSEGPNVTVAGKHISNADFQKITKEINKVIEPIFEELSLIK
ncbi:MAG: 2Fe-2S iron-sulfur cluster binding domain-containing protein [Ignavibacteriae bacterium]|nr:ferredoxin [Ignavibacteriota bacterium]NOG96354.1 2Fe-2S iron-sulfur cluster binding domain-containing protein [Ignavibacteriota bacterium]